MTDAQAVRCRKGLEQFLVDLLEPVGRSERRHWGELYVRSDAQRRREAGIPEEIVFRKKWELALEIIDQIRG